jgi:hypothetical protein
MGTKADGLRHWAIDGARGVLMATACCAPDGTLTDCRQIWDLGREDDGPTPDDRVDVSSGHVHVVGAR